MAIWQYSFLIVPSGASSELEASNGIRIDEDGFVDDEHYWNKYPTPISTFFPIAYLLIQLESWSPPRTRKYAQ